jgi:replicative DNA helicase
MAQSCPSAANIARYADLLRDHALRRSLAAGTGEVSDMALHMGERSALQVLDTAQSKLSTLAETRSVQELVHVSEAMVPYMAQVEARVGGEVGVQAIATGLAGLDALLNGGPSMGTTALAVNIACNAARGARVMVLSMEMILKELIDRVIASPGSVELQTVAKPELLNDAEWARFCTGNEAMVALNLHMDDQPALSLLQVRNKARRAKRTHRLDLLVIDHIQRGVTAPPIGIVDPDFKTMV